jgi:DNA-binding response OmpR family regulator
MGHNRILVVDDSQFASRLIAEHLTKVGYMVTVKNNLVEALNWLQRPGNFPDLIISDVAMSSTDDHGFIRELRSDPASLHPLVILLSTQDDLAEKVAGFEAGADDYVVKPVNTIELGLRVRALLVRAHM